MQEGSRSPWVHTVSCSRAPPAKQAERIEFHVRKKRLHNILEYSNILSMQLKELCKAVGNPERVRLIACLTEETTVNDLLKKCSLSQSALSQHLGVLRDAGIVQAREEGRHVYYRTTSRKYIDLANTIIALTT